MLSSSLSPTPPWSQQVRHRPANATMQMGTQPQRGEAPQILQVNTAPLQRDLATFPPVQEAGFMLFVHRCTGHKGSTDHDWEAIYCTPS